MSKVITLLGDSSSTSLEIDFDVTAMFSWAQTIISALMPVVYVTMGIGLGFLIIRALRSAFN
jgi:hypothetical protein